MNERRAYPHVLVNGRTTSIQVGQLDVNPTIDEALDVMRVISDHTGHTWLVVKMSGYWHVSCPGLNVAWGTEPGARTRDFHRAVANATGFAVVSEMSL